MLFVLNMIVKGWVTFIRPIAVSFGAAFAALNLDGDLISELGSILKYDPKVDHPNKRPSSVRDCDETMGIKAEEGEKLKSE